VGARHFDGKVLLHATSDAIFDGQGTRQEHTKLPQLVAPRSMIFTSLNNSGVDIPYKFLIGQFTLPDGRVAALLQNQVRSVYILEYVNTYG
jgi:hypothetical protein